MEETSLADFAGGGDTPSQEDAAAESGVDDGRTGDDPSVAVTEDGPTLESTYRWVPSARPCPICGADARGGWRTDDGFVCGDCKDW